MRPKITLRGFKPNARGAGHVLGKLEADVMRVLWRQPNQTVSEVKEKLRGKREIARTTVLTTLDRVHRKGYLTREKSGKAFVYAPRFGRKHRLTEAPAKRPILPAPSRARIPRAFCRTHRRK